MTKKIVTKLVRCSHSIEGPSAGRWVVTGRRQCKTYFRVPHDWSDLGNKCRHHRSAREREILRTVLDVTRTHAS